MHTAPVDVICHPGSLPATCSVEPVRYHMENNAFAYRPTPCQSLSQGETQTLLGRPHCYWAVGAAV